MFRTIVCFFLGISTNDPSLGKIDKSSLSHQTLMELFIENIIGTEAICKSPNEDISEWDGVSLDDSGNVISISWIMLSLDGSFSLEWLPSTVHELQMRETSLEGSIDLTILPDDLQECSVDGNSLTGEICLTKLPETLKILNVNMNSLCGTLDLTKLPKTLESLYLHDNKFHGSIDLTKLPSNLRDLYLSDNPLEGETDFTQLPEALQRFWVHRTKLTGTLVVPSEKQFLADSNKIRMKFA
mmetsp:Transcript_19899/g.31195  ORF Transcript_19899/g.31195 Transcript_19899/m.31195 type:complete len:241 (-) Transcript_19899:33-755(-)